MKTVSLIILLSTLLLAVSAYAGDTQPEKDLRLAAGCLAK